MEIESTEISEYVKSTIEGIENGLNTGYELKGEINFELVIANTEKVHGGLKIKVINLSKNVSKENASKIKFKIGKETTPYVFTV